ncbi:hypothetical protein ACFC1W_01315 [Microbacterium sp. NPDC056003]|uniref:hypothetical protein n=1 Tax=Microbacterium sp. NPDC056003 TaxID=3345676 RepID=UPI0035D61D8C
MSDETAGASSSRSWKVWELVISLVLGAGVIGFLVAVAAPFAVEWIKQGLKDDAEGFVSGFWRILLVVVVGLACLAVLVVLLLTIFRKSWRANTWGRLRKWRPFTTTDRIKSERSEAVESYLASIERDALTKAQDRPKGAATGQLSAKAARGQINIPRGTSPMNPGGGFARTYESSIPLPRPRWGVFRKPDGDGKGQFVLMNSVERSVAKAVRLDEVLVGTFYFVSGAQWDDMSGRSMEEFQGRPDMDALHYGLQFRVTWYNENDEQLEQVVELPKESRLY